MGGFKSVELDSLTIWNIFYYFFQNFLHGDTDEKVDLGNKERPNVHVLLNIPKFVKNYGALWAWPAFIYETFNGAIKQLFHGGQYVPDQICKPYNCLRYLKNQAHIFSLPDTNKKARITFIKLMNQCNVKNCIKNEEDLKIFGAPVKKNLTTTEKVIIDEI